MALHLEVIEFALGINANVVTFHPGEGDKESANPYRMEFARRVLDTVKGSDLVCGYKCFDRQLIDQINDPMFCLLYDLGHADKGVEDYTEQIIQMIKSDIDKIVEFHVHGVYKDPLTGKIE